MSATRQFEIRKSTDEEFDYTIEFIIQDPKAPAYDFSSANVTAVDDTDNVTDRTAEIINAGRTSVSTNKVTFGLKAGVNGRVYVVKVQGVQADGQKRSAWGTVIINDPV